MALHTFPRPLAVAQWPVCLGRALILACLIALAAFSAYQSRQHYERQARLAAANLSQSLGNHLHGIIEKTDFSLRTIGLEIERQAARGGIDPAALGLFLRQQESLLPEVLNMKVADGSGAIRYGAGLLAEPAGGSVADSPYFIRLRDDAQAGLVIGGLVREGDRQLVVLARRLGPPGGAFAGVVLATIRVERLQEILASPDLGLKGVVSLRTADLRGLVRLPPLEEFATVRNQLVSPAYRESVQRNPRQGIFVGANPAEGIERTVAYRRIGGYPLYIAVGLAQEDYLAPWWSEVTRLAWIVLLFSLITLWLLRHAQRAARKEQASHRLLEEAVDSVATAFAIFDPQDRLVLCNGAAADTAMAAPGAAFEDILRAGVRQGRYPQALENPEQWVRERLGRHRAADGQPFEQALHDGRRLLIIEHRTPSGHVVTNRIDITELAQYRDQLEKLVEARTAEVRQSAARFRSIFEQAAVGLVYASLDGRILQFNDRYGAIVGYGREELEKLTFQDITWADDREADADHRARLLAGTVGSYAIEKRYVRKDGSPVWVNLTVALIRKASGEPDYLLGAVEDIQQRKAVEQALAEEREARHTILARQVAERTVALQAANNQLEGFIYAASHDLKGPLGRINSFSTLLERGYRDRLEGDGLLFLDFIRDNAIRLAQFVDDLLAHARIDQETPQLRSMDLRASVQAALREKADDIREGGAVVRLDLPAAQVLAEPYGLAQVLRNLLENALKYSAPSGEPAIEIGGQALADRFRVWVRDNGIGFDMEYHDRIFEIFRRLHTYAEYAGSGVGLALVKRAMERMGGRVWAESEPGQGATFYLEFVCAGASLADPAPASA